MPRRGMSQKRLANKRQEVDAKCAKIDPLLRQHPIMDADCESTSMDWQVNRSLSECTTHLYMNKHLSDVIIVLTSAQPPRRIPAHRFLLAIRSPVFEAMFYGLLGTGEREVTLSDVPVDGFLELLRFMYTDVAKIHSDNAMKCLKVGHMYRVSGFVQKCETFLMGSIDESNVLFILQSSLIFDLKTLKQRSLVYIAINAPAVFKHKSFLSISNEVLAMIIQKSDLQAPEVEIYQAVNRWAEKKCEQEGALVSHENKRQYLGDTFSLLRLGHIPVSDFARVVVKENLLSKDEMVMVYSLHHDDTISELDFVENAKRDGTAACSVPLEIREYIDHLKPQCLTTFFAFNQGINLVGLSMKCKLDKVAKPGVNRYISIVLTSYQLLLKRRHVHFHRCGTIYHLDESTLVNHSNGHDINEFEIMFDSSISLEPDALNKMCFVIFSVTGQIISNDPSFAAWKLFAKDKQTPTAHNNYVHHDLLPNTEQDDVITALLTT